VKGLLVVLAALAIPATAAADERGPWLHAELGPAWVDYQNDYSGTRAKGSGPAIGLLLGGRASAHVILYASLEGATVARPKRVDFNGIEFETPEGSSLRWGAVGVGMLYLFGADLYLGGGITNAGARFDDTIAEEGYHLGFGLSLRAGKEWQIAKKWTIGLAIRFGAASAERDYAQVSASELGLLFAGSYR
jgi:hypothetical protein